MEKDKFNKFILLFILFQPILDVLTSLQIRNDIFFMSIGTLIRGLFFLIIIVYLYKNKMDKKYFFMFLLYAFLAISYQIFYTKNNLVTEIINLVKIFYLPFLIYFFNTYDNKKINDKLIVILYLIYINLIIIPYIFGFGFNIYKPYEHKGGYIGLFYSGNEISAIILGMLPIVLNYIIKAKNYILKVFILIETIVTVILVGTKTLLIGFIVVILYFILKYIKDNYKKISLFKKILSLVCIIVFICLTILISSKLSVGKNLQVALDYYKINSISDIVSINGMDKIIFSNRLTYLNHVSEEYSKSDIQTIIYGLGNTKIINLKDIEIDVFDLFFSIGILGTFMYVVMIVVSTNKVKLKGYYKFSLILLILISLISGHVLLEPMVSIYIALLFILNKNNKEDNRKRILLVSNMYPNSKYKFYGSFVKNTKKLLEENDFVVDKSVKYKETSFFGKLFSYMFFYIKTCIMGIFNNYDYIYVHYISHSTLGAVIPKITSKNTKLVLNAHGNDVVTDYDFEEKNIKKSKKFLKYADNVIVPSNYYKNIMINDYNIDGNKICVYPSGGVDTEKFIKKDKDEAKKNSGLLSDYNYVGYISRIEKNKGYDIFLKAIKELEKEDKIGNKKFLIIGTGSEENKLNELIKELDILKYLEIRNMVSQDDLVDIYNSLDLFIFPTYRKSESLGLVGLEAMSCETFVIASKNYGPTDYLVNKKNGLLFEPENAVDLKNKILEYENLNNEQYKRIIKKARETAIKYDFKNTAHIILNVFK